MNFLVFLCRAHPQSPRILVRSRTGKLEFSDEALSKSHKAAADFVLHVHQEFLDGKLVPQCCYNMDEMHFEVCGCDPVSAETLSPLVDVSGCS